MNWLKWKHEIPQIQCDLTDLKTEQLKQDISGT